MPVSRLLAVALAALAAIPVAATASAAAPAAEKSAGGRLAFVRDADIFTVNADGTRERRLTDTGDNANPAWSPDGSRIAFDSTRGGDWDVYVLHVATGRLDRLTSSAADETDPTWSPNGDEVAYVADGAVWRRASTAPFAGLTRVTPVPPAPTGDDEYECCYINYDEPDWSADGRRIAFLKVKMDSFGYSRTTVGAIDLETREQVGYARSNELRWYDEPKWAPDGSTLLVTQNFDLVSIATDARTVTRITRNDNTAWGSWSGSGRQIAFTTRYDRIGTMDADGTGRKIIARGTHADWTAR